MSTDLTRRINEKRQRIRQASISASITTSTTSEKDATELSCLVGKTKSDQDSIVRGMTCEKAIQAHVTQHGIASPATLSLLAHYNHLGIFLNGLVAAESANREAKCLAKVHVQYRNYKSDSFIFKTRIVLVQYMLAMLDFSTRRDAMVDGMSSHIGHCIAICHHFASQLDNTAGHATSNTFKHRAPFELDRDFYIILLDLLRARLLDVETYGSLAGLPLSIHKHVDTDDSTNMFDSALDTKNVDTFNTGSRNIINTMTRLNTADKVAQMTLVITTSKCLDKNLAVWSAYSKMMRILDKFESATVGLYDFYAPPTSSAHIEYSADDKTNVDHDDDDAKIVYAAESLLKVVKVSTAKQAVEWVQCNESRLVKACRDLTATCHGTMKFDKRLMTVPSSATAAASVTKHQQKQRYNEFDQKHSDTKRQQAKTTDATMAAALEESSLPRHVRTLLEQLRERALVLKIILYRNLAKWYYTHFKISNTSTDLERGLLCFRRACGAMSIISKRACMSKSFEQVRGIKVSKINQWLLSDTNRYISWSRDNDLYYYTWPMYDATTSDAELLPAQGRIDASHSAEACVKEWNLAKLQETIELV